MATVMDGPVIRATRAYALSHGTATRGTPMGGTAAVMRMNRLNTSCHVGPSQGERGVIINHLTVESSRDGVPQKRTVHMSTSTAASLMPVSVKIPEAARLLGFHDSKTIYRLIRAGKLKARKVGRNYLVSYKSIVKLIEG